MGSVIRDQPELLVGAVVHRVGRVCAERGLRRVALLHDRGVERAGHVEAVRGYLLEAGLAVVPHSVANENPTTDDVHRAVEAIRLGGVDGIVAVGGGSVLDTAKAANVLLTNGGRLEDYLQRGVAETALLPLVAVMTTAGTGSEMQMHALISRADTHAKWVVGVPDAMPHVALLDPSLTVSMPWRVTAHTGLDALVHAVETAVCTTATDASRALSIEAFSMVMTHLPRVLDAPTDLVARRGMLEAASKAGRAIHLSMLGAAHAAANPLTATFDVPHGAAVGCMLPAVIEFNRSQPRADAVYRHLEEAAGLKLPIQSAISALVDRCCPLGLTAWRVGSDAIPSMASRAAAQWTARFNPRPIGRADFISLYESALQSN